MARPLIPYKKQYFATKRPANTIDVLAEFQRVERGIPSFGCVRIGRDHRVEAQDYILDADSSERDVTISLPPPEDAVSQEILVIKSTLVNSVLVTGFINGATITHPLSGQYDSIRLVSIGSSWVMI